MLDFQYFQLLLFGLFIAKERLVIAVGKIEDPRLAAFFRDSARDSQKSGIPRVEPTGKLRTLSTKQRKCMKG